MGEIADRLDRLTVRVSSPDGNIRATVGHARVRSIELRPGAYETYTEATLEHQVERLATLAFIGHDRGVARIMEASGIRRYKDPALADDLAERRYLERVHDITVTATGPGDFIRLRMASGMRWQCRIADGTLAARSAAEFLDELAAAARNLLRRNTFEVRLLKDECFGLNVEELARERRRRAAERNRA